MQSKLKEVLLIGYGAVGAMYALMLKRSGQARVTIVARSNYEATKANGMHIKSQKYGDIPGWRPDRLCSSFAEAADQAYTHVVLTTKVVPELQRTPDLLSPLIQPPYSDKYPQPTYVLMQNGLNVEVDLYKALQGLKPDEEPRIINTSLWIGTRLTSKDVVEHSYFDRVEMGICRSTPNIMMNTPAESAILSEFGDMLSAGGTEVTIVSEIQRYKFEKNIWNSVLGPATVLPRYSLQAVFRSPSVTAEHPEPTTFPVNPNEENVSPSRVKTASIPASFPVVAESTIPWLYDTLAEVAAVGNALFPPGEDGKPVFGDDTGLSILQRSATIASKPTSSERPSILVDVEMGRPTEVEVLVGEVVRAGRRLGVPIPRMETLYALMSVIQAQLLHEHFKRAT
ncbi:6-phosphogluconate dehydrogenase C-terminal domain-like protein [Panus rudis PR-1116 ss-1]|nr:6-phosphogluconate dehydrogenase C-terminal domain-like protein [Panus rudis PR-1116 ss-1]